MAKAIVTSSSLLSISFCSFEYSKCSCSHSNIVTSPSLASSALDLINLSDVLKLRLLIYWPSTLPDYGLRATSSYLEFWIASWLLWSRYSLWALILEWLWRNPLVSYSAGTWRCSFERLILESKELCWSYLGASWPSITHRDLGKPLRLQLLTFIIELVHSCLHFGWLFFAFGFMKLLSNWSRTSRGSMLQSYSEDRLFGDEVSICLMKSLFWIILLGQFLNWTISFGAWNGKITDPKLSSAKHFRFSSSLISATCWMLMLDLRRPCLPLFDRCISLLSINCWGECI